MAKYKSGEEAMVGDLVKCSIEGCTCDHSEFKAESILNGSDIHLCGERYPFPAVNFELIRRAPAPEPEQPAVTMPAQEPLVVWPEEKPTLTWNDLPDQSLFVWVKCPDMPCLRDESRWFVVANHKKASKLLFCGSDEVRRIQFNPANKEPVFTVI